MLDSFRATEKRLSRNGNGGRETGTQRVSRERDDESSLRPRFLMSPFPFLSFPFSAMGRSEDSTTWVGVQFPARGFDAGAAARSQILIGSPGVVEAVASSRPSGEK